MRKKLIAAFQNSFSSISSNVVLMVVHRAGTALLGKNDPGRLSLVTETETAFAAAAAAPPSSSEGEMAFPPSLAYSDVFQLLLLNEELGAPSLPLLLVVKPIQGQSSPIKTIDDFSE
jgi:hypothetical protein